eukprot:CAMPEP_0183382322 /NCGR_PEP_ID=MMETSP0164_2-20130417/126885_1 /TAXON_ID=221442 /ORGANISM="Coccolithus pelagicus ssp braarudi, Strain PLY182g" /LENGTH=37 /DNA_ID= /DNA_START= /DNA_END= /DNA_ORIENTATION=
MMHMAVLVATTTGSGRVDLAKSGCVPRGTSAAPRNDR